MSSLIVATFELKAVDAVLSAIHGADAASAASARGPLGLTPAAVYEPRRHIHPEPKIEARPHLHPTPFYEARPVVHPERIYASVPACDVPAAPTVSHITKSPIEPPWKTLPWPQSQQVLRKVKLFIRRPDSVSKGSLIDCMM